MKTRNLFITGIAFCLVSLLFWQCGQNTKTNDSGTTISIIGESSSTLDAMMSLKQDYQKRHPNITLDFKPNTFKDALNKSNSDFNEGTGLYDIILEYNFTLSPGVQNGYVYKIKDLTGDIKPEQKSFEKDIFPAVWQEVGYYYKDNTNKDAEMISYPYTAISMVLMYNKPMFEDAANKTEFERRYKHPLAVPSTWKEFYEVSEFFTNPSRKTFGVCMEGDAEFLVAEWTSFLFGMGGKYMDKEVGWHGDLKAKLLFNTPEAVKALEFYTSLKPFNSGNYTSVTQAKQMEIMKEGHTAMAIAWTDQLYNTIKTEDGFDNRFAFTIIPGGKSMLSGGAYFINKKSKSAKAAANFVIDQLQVENQIAMTRKGLCSSLQSVYKDSLVQKIPYADALQKSLSRGGIALEAGPDAMMITEIIATYIQQAWNNDLSPAEALNKVQMEIEKKRPEYFQAQNK